MSRGPPDDPERGQAGPQVSFVDTVFERPSRGPNEWRTPHLPAVMNDLPPGINGDPNEPRAAPNQYLNAGSTPRQTRASSPSSRGSAFQGSASRDGRPQSVGSHGSRETRGHPPPRRSLPTPARSLSPPRMPQEPRYETPSQPPGVGQFNQFQGQQYKGAGGHGTFATAAPLSHALGSRKHSSSRGSSARHSSRSHDSRGSENEHEYDDDAPSPSAYEMLDPNEQRIVYEVHPEPTEMRSKWSMWWTSGMNPGSKSHRESHRDQEPLLKPPKTSDRPPPAPGITRNRVLMMLVGLLLTASVIWGLVELSRKNAKHEYVTTATRLGQLKGVVVKTTTTRGQSVDVVNWRGIPYTAHPPVGPLRFKQMTVAVDRYPGGKYDATQFKNKCISKKPTYINLRPSGQMGEDCLYLNIWTPKAAMSGNASLPVYVFVHGGGLREGSGSFTFYDGAAFAASNNVVVVTINYRLGPFGFLVTTGHSTPPASAGSGGMNGFIDVLVALQWVQNYVRGFHGNPTAVTLWGQSSGSVAVCTLNVSPRAKGLFQNVIMQSGPCTGAMWGVQGAEAGAAVADAMMTHFKVTTIDELRRLKPDGLWWDEMNNSTISFFLEKSTAFVDHWLLTDLPIVAYRNHAVNAQRAIVGATSKDGVMLTKDRMHDGALIPHSQAAFQEAVSRSYGAIMPFRTGRLVDQSEVIARVNDLYNPQLDGRFHGDVEAAFVESDGDVSVVCPMKELAKMMHAAGTVVWHYAFEFGPTELDMSVQVKLRSPITPLRGSEHWASHSSELPYVFHNPCAICVDLTCRMDQVCLQESRSRWTDPAGSLSRRMVKAWGTLMSPTGPWVNDFEPNAQTSSENNRTYWHSLSAYTNGSVPTWIFDAQDRLMVGYRHDACDMWLQDVEQANLISGSTLGSG